MAVTPTGQVGICVKVASRSPFGCQKCKNPWTFVTGVCEWSPVKVTMSGSAQTGSVAATATAATAFTTATATVGAAETAVVAATTVAATTTATAFTAAATETAATSAGWACFHGTCFVHHQAATAQ